MRSIPYAMLREALDGRELGSGRIYRDVPMFGSLRDEHPRGQLEFAASFRFRSQVYVRARAATMTDIKIRSLGDRFRFLVHRRSSPVRRFGLRDVSAITPATKYVRAGYPVAVAYAPTMR